MMKFTNVFTPSDSNQIHLLQPFFQFYSEPNHISFLNEHVLGFIDTDPDTIPLKESMEQHDCDNFIGVTRK